LDKQKEKEKLKICLLVQLDINFTKEGNSLTFFLDEKSYKKIKSKRFLPHKAPRHRVWTILPAISNEILAKF